MDKQRQTAGETATTNNAGYRITTNPDLAAKYKLPKPLPTAEEINDSETKLLSEWLFVEKYESFDENGEVTFTIFGDLTDPIFTAKVLYKGVERDALYKPLADQLAIINLEEGGEQ